MTKAEIKEKLATLREALAIETDQELITRYEAKIDQLEKKLEEAEKAEEKPKKPEKKEEKPEPKKTDAYPYIPDDFNYGAPIDPAEFAQWYGDSLSQAQKDSKKKRGKVSKKQLIVTTIEGDTVSVESPYNNFFVSKARGMRGKWSGGKWVFDISQLENVRNALKKAYGVTGEEPYEAVTLLVKDFSDKTYRDGVELFGRPIAKAWGRDSGAKLGPEIYLLDGRVDSGGSVKNWSTEVKDATFEIHDFPVEALERTDVKNAIKSGQVEVLGLEEIEDEPKPKPEKTPEPKPEKEKNAGPRKPKRSNFKDDEDFIAFLKEELKNSDLDEETSRVYQLCLDNTLENLELRAKLEEKARKMGVEEPEQKSTIALKKAVGEIKPMPKIEKVEAATTRLINYEVGPKIKKIKAEAIKDEEARKAFLSEKEKIERQGREEIKEAARRVGQKMAQAIQKAFEEAKNKNKE